SLNDNLLTEVPPSLIQSNISRLSFYNNPIPEEKRVVSPYENLEIFYGTLISDNGSSKKKKKKKK
ncbi:MAG: hypothetical protein MUF42_12075, partial [Cytophagaceae bacterium]|nr:hypothetical protein [Cytophagaceae bacterium]